MQSTVQSSNDQTKNSIKSLSEIRNKTNLQSDAEKLQRMGKSGFMLVDLKSKIKDGDLQQLSNAVVMEINSMAAQLFELISLLSELILNKPKRVYTSLADQYQSKLENSYGEHILRQVVLTQDFSFPSED